MKVNLIGSLSFACIAASVVFGGCVDSEPQSQDQDVPPPAMTPWTGTPSPEIAKVLAEHGGVQISENQIAWNEGKVVLTIGSPQSVADTGADAETATGLSANAISPDAASDCPSGWFCLWQDAGFTNRRLQFSDTGCQNLTDFGFNDQASSWNNRTSAAFRVYRDVSCKPLLFTAPANSQSSNVGSANNDKASSICRGSCP